MKRMYVALAIMFTFVFYAGTLLGQQKSRPTIDPKLDGMEKRMQLREEIHRRMMDNLLRGIGSDEDMFSDMEKMMEEAMSESFNGISSFRSSSFAKNYKAQWNETASGRTLEITPATPEQKLDIDVTNGMVTIKGKSEVKTQGGVAVSNFSNSFTVPADCDFTKVKMDQKDGKILVQFPYTAAGKPKTIKKEEDRKPLPPSESDVEV